MVIGATIGGSGLALLGMFGVWQSWRLWHDPNYADRMMLFNSVLPFSKEVRRGAVRGALPLAAALELASAGILVFSASNPVPGRPQASVIVAGVCFALMMVAFGMHVTIIHLNRPLWLVPPHMRQQHGAWMHRKRERPKIHDRLSSLSRRAPDRRI